jgi:hypothetical protein
MPTVSPRTMRGSRKGRHGERLPRPTSSTGRNQVVPDPETRTGLGAFGVGSFKGTGPGFRFTLSAAHFSPKVRAFGGRAASRDRRAEPQRQPPHADAKRVGHGQLFF